MTVSVHVKSGTGGYDDYDGCDLLVKELNTENFPIPRIGESLEIWEENDEKRIAPNGEIYKVYHQYLVTDVRYWITDTRYGVNIYVLPIGRSV